MELPLGFIVWEAPFHSFPFYTVTSYPHSHWSRQCKNVIQKAIQESFTCCSERDQKIPVHAIALFVQLLNMQVV